MLALRFLEDLEDGEINIGLGKVEQIRINYLE